MNDAVWQIEHSVDTIATPEFAWAYMTNVANWHDPPAQFRLEGPFATGGRGSTEMPGQPPRPWQLRDVQPMDSYTVQFSFDRAVFSCTWRFTALPDHRTRLTQRLTLEGENASEYVTGIRQAFEPGLAAGMNRIATAINQSYAATR